MKNRILLVNIFRYSNEILFPILFCKIDLTRLSHFGKVFDVQFKAPTKQEKHRTTGLQLSQLVLASLSLFLLALLSPIMNSVGGGGGFFYILLVMLSQLLLLFFIIAMKIISFLSHDPINFRKGEPADSAKFLMIP